MLRRSLLSLAVTLLAVAGCGSGSSDAAGEPDEARDSPETFMLTGEMRLVDFYVPPDLGGACAGKGGYGDIVPGAQVVVRAGGDVVAAGSLDAGELIQGRGCIIGFRVAEVPSGHDFYGVEVTQRGEIQVTESQARSGDVSFSLG
jgi:hypothetical protein